MAAKGGTGSLFDKIKTASESIPGGTCTAGKLLEALTPADRADLEAALADRSIPATIIAKVLTETGHKIGDDAVQRHRRGACACGRTR